MAHTKLSPPAGLSLLISFSVIPAVSACQRDDPGDKVYATDEGGGGSGGSDSSAAGSSASGAIGGRGGASGGVAGTGATGGTGAAGSAGSAGTGGVEPNECVGTPVATLRSPVDFIFTVDQSGSMGDEAMRIEQNLSGALPPVIAATALDYQVVMVADALDSSIPVCIGPPLGGNACGEPGARFFQSNVHVGGNAVLSTLVSSYDHATMPWSGALRAHSEKAFIVVSDDDSVDLDDNAFLTAVAQLQPSGVFGTEDSPDFVFHSIVGVASEAAPADPIQVTACGSLSSPGEVYQHLSVRTGGVRFPICNQDYSPAFQQIVDNAAKRTKCRYSLDLAGLQDTDRSKLNVTYTTGAGTDIPLHFAPSGPCDRGWQYDATESKVVLCSQTCTDVFDDAEGSVRFLVGCDSI